MGHRPYTFTKVELATFLERLKTCLNSKGTTYYNKISGAVKCSNNDLSKLELIIYLVSKYDAFIVSADSKYSLDCLFNGKPFPGFVWEAWDWQVEGLDDDGNPIITELPITEDNTYLQEFLDFAEKFCRDCIVTTSPAPPSPAEEDVFVKAEDGVSFLLLEDNVTKIEL